MNGMNLLVSEHSRQHHPLAVGFSLEEAFDLVNALRSRLNCTLTELDLSPASLKRLEQRLPLLHKSMQEQNLAFTEEELFQLVREIGAYVGLVLVIHTGGKWRNLDSLWGTEIVIEGPIRVIEGHRSYTSAYPMVFSLGNIAANAWDLIVNGSTPNFYRKYRAAKRKVSKQILR